MGALRILGETLDNAEILKNMHYAIKDRRLPIALKEDLDEQVIEVEEYYGKEELRQLNSKKKKVNIWTGILAVPILLYCIFLFLSRYVHYFGINLDISNTNQMLFNGIIKHWWILVLYAVSFFGLIAYFYILNRKSENLIQKTLNRFFS